MKKVFSALLCISFLIVSTACSQKKQIPISEALTKVFNESNFSSTESELNLDSSGYYVTEKPAQVFSQPSSVVDDYFCAMKRDPDTANSINRTSYFSVIYAEFTNEQDTKNVFATGNSDIVSHISESGLGYYTDNSVIGFYVPTIGEHDEFCAFSILYRSDSAIIYITVQGPLSYIEQHQDIIIKACKTVGYDPTEKYNELLATLKEST